MEEKSV